MKNLFCILVIGLMLLCTSCGNKQKPSQRANVWKTEATKSSEISLSSDKVSVPFKRTMSGLAEVQVSLNGVPFNMYWDTVHPLQVSPLWNWQNLQKKIKLVKKIC